MAARIPPKTLAKTLSYIGLHAPGEHGLFWDADGSMPWKEFYWALQEDPELRFVKEGSIKEIQLLGLDFPFFLEEAMLRLREKDALPYYRAATPPPRLFHSIKPRQYVTVSRTGLALPSSRTYLPLFASEEWALRYGLRRGNDPLVVEIRAQDALDEGIVFRRGGEELYLTADPLPVRFLVLPKMSEEEIALIQPRKKKAKPEAAGPGSYQPAGSFPMDSSYFDALFGPREGGAKSKGKGKKGKGPDWKRKSRDDRHKREI